MHSTVLAVRYGRTWNLGNYESAKCEVEVAPAPDQNGSEALTEAISFVNAQQPAKTIAATAAKPVSATSLPNSPAPPLANKSAKSADPPFESGSQVAAEPAPKKRRGRPKKSETAVAPEPQPPVEPVKNLNDAAHKLLTLGLPKCADLEAVADLFDGARALAVKRPKENWDTWKVCVKDVATHIRTAFPAHMADPQWERLSAMFAAEELVRREMEPLQ